MKIKHTPADEAHADGKRKIKRDANDAASQKAKTANKAHFDKAKIARRTTTAAKARSR